MPRVPRAVRIVGTVADEGFAVACAGRMTPAAVDAARVHALGRDAVILDGVSWATRRREREAAAAVVPRLAAATHERGVELTTGDVWDGMGEGADTPCGSQPSQCSVWERAPAACDPAECVGSLDGLGTVAGLGAAHPLRGGCRA